MYRGSRRIEQEDFLKKKKTLEDTLGNSPAAATPVSSPPERVRTLEGPETTGTGESAQDGTPHSPEEGECLNLWVQGALESWAGGCPSAGWDREELG